MTARELHEATYLNPDRDSYQGGMALRGPDGGIQGGVDIVSRHGDIDVSVNASAGRACSTAVVGLTAGEARELALGLERAATAAENYEREN